MCWHYVFFFRCVITTQMQQQHSTSETTPTPVKQADALPNLPADWYKHLKVGMGEVLTEEEFKRMCQKTGKNPTIVDDSVLKK